MKKWQFFLILFLLSLIMFKLEQLQDVPNQLWGFGCIALMTASIIGSGWYFLVGRR